ncbi:MAG: retroviral-like aspartic protease family protein [Gammaproteobacteria bacterium]|nr:retroviral-like aspartic protease family protein [Gammaproteobacteria bacterium]
MDFRDGRAVDSDDCRWRGSAWNVTLSRVEVGGIRVDNVRAAIIEGEHPREILLGMSFLRNVEMRESSGVLVLTSKM